MANLGWQSAPDSLLVPLFELLLDGSCLGSAPAAPVARLTLPQLVQQRLHLAAVCRRWRDAVQQTCASVADPAPAPASRLLWASGLRLREATLVVAIPSLAGAPPFLEGTFHACNDAFLQLATTSTLQHLDLTFHFLGAAAAEPQQEPGLPLAFNPVMLSGARLLRGLRLRSLKLTNNQGCPTFLYGTPLDLLHSTQRLELAGTEILSFFLPDADEPADPAHWLAQGFLDSPCRSLLLHNPKRAMFGKLFMPAHPTQPAQLDIAARRTWDLEEQLAALPEASGGALDVVHVSLAPWQGSLQRVVRTADLAPPQHRARLDLSMLSTFEQLAAVVQSGDSGEVVSFCSSGPGRSGGVLPEQWGFWEERQTVLANPRFLAANSGCLRRLEGLLVDGGLHHLGLEQYPHLRQVAVAQCLTEEGIPLLPPTTVSRLELSSPCLAFDAISVHHLTHLQELILSDWPVYRSLSLLPRSLTALSLSLSLPAQVNLQRLRVPRLVLTHSSLAAGDSSGGGGINTSSSGQPLVVHLQHWQSVAQHLVLRHSGGIVLKFPAGTGGGLGDLFARLTRCKWLQSLTFELQLLPETLWPYSHAWSSASHPCSTAGSGTGMNSELPGGFAATNGTSSSVQPDHMEPRIAVPSIFERLKFVAVCGHFLRTFSITDVMQHIRCCRPEAGWGWQLLPSTSCPPESDWAAGTVYFQLKRGQPSPW